MNALPNWKTMARDERDSLLRQYINDNLTVALVAERFSDCTRSAVMGVAYRLKLTFHGDRKNGEAKPLRRKEAVVKPPKAVASRRTTGSWGGIVSKVKAAKARKQAPSCDPQGLDGLIAHSGDPFEPLPGCEPVHFVKNTGCRFPVDGLHGPSVMFCGAPPKSFHPYCEAHCRIAYTNPMERAS